MEEIWKDIKGYEGYYQISNMGRVKSVARNIHGGRFNCDRWFPEKILKLGLRPNGYLKVCLNKNNDRRDFSIHRLVANAFIENTDNLPQVNHRNGIKTDNIPDNMEWCTQSQNMLHAYSIGLQKPNYSPRPHLRGENNPSSKLTNEIATTIRKRYADEKITYNKLGEIYDVHKKTIAYIIRNKRYICV